jgi:hypothetical protein
MEERSGSVKLIVCADNRKAAIEFWR